MMHSGLRIKKFGKKGRGMVCDVDLEADEIIEVSPVIVLPKKDQAFLDQTLMHDYIFLWGTDDDPKCAVALGYISIYNHSYDANCDYIMYYEEELIVIRTVKPIPAGTELTINYNGDPSDDTPIWFNAEV